MVSADRNINLPTNKTFAMWALFITGGFSTRLVRTDADIDKKDGWRIKWLLADIKQQLNALGGISDRDRFKEDVVGKTTKKLTKQSTDIKAAKEVRLPHLLRHILSHSPFGAHGLRHYRTLSPWDAISSSLCAF